MLPTRRGLMNLVWRVGEFAFQRVFLGVVVVPNRRDAAIIYQTITRNEVISTGRIVRIEQGHLPSVDVILIINLIYRCRTERATIGICTKVSEQTAR